MTTVRAPTVEDSFDGNPRTRVWSGVGERKEEGAKDGLRPKSAKSELRVAAEKAFLLYQQHLNSII